MTVAYEQLIQHLDGHQLSYHANSDAQSIYAEFRGDAAAYRIVAVVTDGGDLFQVFGHFPVRIPQGARHAVAQTISRANYGLKVGKFEMGYDDGELRFQAAQILTEGGLEDDVIERMISTTLRMLDAYLPAILSVVFGNELPEEAIQQVEGGSRSEEQRSDPPDDIEF